MVRHGPMQCMVRTKVMDFFSVWDREREEAESRMADTMRMGATIWCGHGDDCMSWKIPPFSTTEELQMKASLIGGGNPLEND